MSIILQNLTKFSYKKVVKPIIFRCEPTMIHEKMLSFAEFSSNKKVLQSLLKSATKYENKVLATNAFGKTFVNPIGLAAGLDKKAMILACLINSGFGYATFGTLTNKKSPGNPKPWFHRLKEYQSLMVYVGLKNDGAAKELLEIENRCNLFISNNINFPIKVSIGLTSDGVVGKEDCVEDITSAMKKTIKSDGIKNKLIELNISCPNTKTGEIYKDKDILFDLFKSFESNKLFIDNNLTIKMPLLEDKGEFFDLLDLLDQFSFVKGLTIANLQKNRKGLNIPDKYLGNMSGKLTQVASDTLIKETYNKYQDRFTIIGVGGIFNAQDAYAKIKNGAALLELVTALIYEGPQVVFDIKKGLVKLLEKDGFTSIEQARGIDVL